MISFSFNIANPFKHEPFKIYWQRDIVISKNKNLEIGFYRYAWNLFEFQVDLRWRGSDHAGPSFEINVLGYTARLGISDSRHWDSTTNDWQKHD